jgi:hypothetical protein
MKIGAVAGAHSWGLLNVRPDREILPIRRINAGNALVFPDKLAEIAETVVILPETLATVPPYHGYRSRFSPSKKELSCEVFGTRALVSRLTC